jgi:hypothetical protein
MIDASVVKRLAIQCGFGVAILCRDEVITDNGVINITEMLQAYAKAVIENYKAGLVPVAWKYKNMDGFWKLTDDISGIWSGAEVIPLYTATQPRAWVGLSDRKSLIEGTTQFELIDEKTYISFEKQGFNGEHHGELIDVTFAIDSLIDNAEAKLKQLNTKVLS